MNYSLVSNIEFGDVNHGDYPDYCDAFITYADYDGIEMTDLQLEQVNENTDFVYNSLINFLN